MWSDERVYPFHIYKLWGGFKGQCKVWQHKYSLQGLRQTIIQNFSSSISSEPKVYEKFYQELYEVFKIVIWVSCFRQKIGWIEVSVESRITPRLSCLSSVFTWTLIIKIESSSSFFVYACRYKNSQIGQAKDVDENKIFFIVLIFLYDVMSCFR